MTSAFRISIGANIALLGIVLALLLRDRPTVPVRVAELPAVRPAQPVIGRVATPQAPAAGLQPRPTGSELTPAVVAQLEQMGISRSILTNVLLERLNQRSARRLLELQKQYAPRLVPEHEMRELSRESDAEQVRELKGAFGEAGYLAWDKEQALKALNRARVPGDELPMSDDEAERAYQLQKKFDHDNRELQMAMEDGVADKADVGLLQAEAQQSLDRDLEKLLGKQRFDELKGTIDPATVVYREFGDLDPTPEQTKAVVQADGDYRAREAALAKKLAEDPAAAANVRDQLDAMNVARDEILRGIFGAEAYDNQKQQNDPTFKTLKLYAGAWELNEPDVQSVYQALHAFNSQADLTRSAAEMREAAGQRVNWREINAAIEQARQQTETGLQSLIGPERLGRLKENGLLGTR
jgi:hypothetical protein